MHNIINNIVHKNHRRHKLRTGGGYARVRALGSIDLFVVTSLKINQLSQSTVRRLQRRFPIDDV